MKASEHKVVFIAAGLHFYDNHTLGGIGCENRYGFWKVIDESIYVALPGEDEWFQMDQMVYRKYVKWLAKMIVT